MKHYLHNLQLPASLKQLSIQDLEQLSCEIREELLEIGKACGGHLASNLGVVELTLALHAVFDSPHDKMVWDTSHQTYVHKMLTGRLDRMFTLRQDFGICGFSNIFESEHDCFGAGHASTALSAALGFAHARDLKKESHSVIAVIGDATLSGGMSFEALNNIEGLRSNFICILNDNNMSISKPVGNMAEYMTRIRTTTAYDQVKQQFERILGKIPRIGVPLKRRIEKLVERLRDVVLDVKAGVLFEEFGFKYLGPINGHDIPSIMAALKYAKNYPGPIMIHLDTTKGKGHLPAEQNPIQYHGLSPQPVTSSAIATPKPPAQPTYTQTFGSAIVELGHKYPEMAVITPAMKEGSGLNAFADTFPNRFFDVGIAEEHAVTFAAGLAKGGIKPVLAIYSTFLQRGFDQLIHDVCLQKLPVIFALDRSGFVGEDGPTHHGVFDLAFMLPIPNLSVLAPKDGDELKAMLTWAMSQPEAVSIRYPKGPIPEQNGHKNTPITSPQIEILWDNRHHPAADIQCLIIAVGSMAWPSYEAAEKLAKEGVSCVVVNLRFIKPLDKDGLIPYLLKADTILVVEEGTRIGGVGAHLLQECGRINARTLWKFLAIDDTFVEHGKIATQRKQFQLSPDGICSAAVSLLKQTHIEHV
jgi:1-deoxy-D-xylulose-5-phosphate synthase